MGGGAGRPAASMTPPHSLALPRTAAETRAAASLRAARRARRRWRSSAASSRSRRASASSATSESSAPARRAPGAAPSSPLPPASPLPLAAPPPPAPLARAPAGGVPPRGDGDGAQVVLEAAELPREARQQHALGPREGEVGLREHRAARRADGGAARGGPPGVGFVEIEEELVGYLVFGFRKRREVSESGGSESRGSERATREEGKNPTRDPRSFAFFFFLSRPPLPRRSSQSP